MKRYNTNIYKNVRGVFNSVRYCGDIYIYIYIYTPREGERKREREID